MNGIRNPFYKVVIYVVPPASLLAGIRIIYDWTFAMDLKYWQLPLFSGSMFRDMWLGLLVIAMLYTIGQVITTSSYVLEHAVLRRLLSRSTRGVSKWSGKVLPERRNPDDNYILRYKIGSRNRVLREQLEDSFEKYVFGRNMLLVSMVLLPFALAMVFVSPSIEQMIVLGASALLVLYWMREMFVRYDWYDWDINEFKSL